VYNFFRPENPNVKQVQAIEAAAQHVLDARAQFPNSGVADLYDRNTMPGISKSPPGIRQSRRRLLPPPTLHKRDQANRVFV
ncbi:MAG: methylase, partial [Daejeonella sp.]|nr:methylase [Daejeonella sp.]